MRAFVAVCGVAAAMSLASVATPEGLGDAAAREHVARERAASPSVSACPTDARIPRLIWAPPPEYPTPAASRGVGGVVDLEVVVAPDGSVRETRVENVGAEPDLVAAAKSHVAQRRYCPAFESGVAVEARVSVRMQFKVAHRKP